MKKEFSIFLSHIRLQKQHSSLMYWLKICKAWVRSQLRCAWNWLKLNHYYSLSACRDVGLTQGSLIPQEHGLYRALKHSIRQNKLDLNLSKTKQPLPIITHLWYGSVPIYRDTKNTDPGSDDKLGESKVIWEINICNPPNC